MTDTLLFKTSRLLANWQFIPYANYHAGSDTIPEVRRGGAWVSGRHAPVEPFRQVITSLAS